MKSKKIKIKLKQQGGQYNAPSTNNAATSINNAKPSSNLASNNTSKDLETNISSY